MEITKNIEIIDLCLYLKKENILILADTHIGYEEALNKQGVLIPRFQFKEIIQRLETILKKTGKLDKIIINGDIKHEFGTISEQEWRHTLRLLDFLGNNCNEIILIKGNHDTILGPIAKKRNVRVVDCVIVYSNGTVKPVGIKSTENKFSEVNLTSLNKPLEIKSMRIKPLNVKNNLLVIHGDKLDENILNLIKNKNIKTRKNAKHFLCPKNSQSEFIRTIIIGHEHPAVSIHEGPRTELFKCFLEGKWKRKTLIVQPSFNLVTEGTDVIKEELLSPFLQQDLSDFECFIVADKVYEFGKLRKFHN